MLSQYLSEFLGYARGRVLVAFLLMLAVAASEGFGLLMLVPLLQLSGLVSDTLGAPGSASLASEFARRAGVAPTLPVLLSFFLVLVVLRAGLSLWRDIYLSRLRLEFVDRLKIRLHEAVGRANWPFLSRQKPADISHTLNADIDRIGDGSYYFLQSLLTCALIGGHTAVALALSAELTLAALTCGGLILLTMHGLNRRAERLGEALTAADQQAFSSVTEFLNGLKLAKSYAAEPSHHRRFVAATQRLRETLLAFTWQRALGRLIFQIAAAAVLSGLLYGAVTVIRLPPAELLVLVLVFSRLLPMFSQLQQALQGIRHMRPAFANAINLQRHCEAAAEVPALRADSPPILRRALAVEGVSFRYPGQSDGPVVLDDITLYIPANTTAAVVGPSGAGKSTLADILIGLLSPDAGKVSVDGRPLAADQLRAWRQTVAYVPQETFLFHDTVRANLRWARPSADDDELWWALSLAAATDFVGRLPVGLDTVVGERGVRLSGGERQRLALARALLRRPQLLVLDEATSALDNESERRIQDAIEGLHGDMTIVVIAHRLSTIRRADQIVVFDTGQIIETGTWDELIANPEGKLSALANAAAVPHTLVGLPSK